MADATLIQSGRRLYQQSAEQANFGDAFNEGAKIITDQIDKNIKTEQAAEKHELDKQRLQLSNALQEFALEEKLTKKEAENHVQRGVIQDAVEAGIIDPTDYESYNQMGSDWLKDETTRLKVLGDAGGQEKLRSRIDQYVKAQDNTQAILGSAAASTPSGLNPYAKELDFALDELQRAGGNVGMVTEKGRDYVVIPNPKGGEDYKIPAETWANAKSFKDLIPGEYKESESFTGAIDNYAKNHKQSFNRLANGIGTTADIKGIAQSFLSDYPTSIQRKEMLDTYLQNGALPAGSETAVALGLEDKNNDGTISSDEVPENLMGEVFAQAVASTYGFDLNNQEGDAIAQQAVDKKLGRGKFAPKAQGSNAITVTNNDYSGFQGIPVKGKSNTLVTNVLPPGTKSGDTTTDQWIIQTSDGKLYQAGNNPNQILQNLTGRSVATPEISEAETGVEIASKENAEAPKVPIGDAIAEIRARKEQAAGAGAEAPEEQVDEELAKAETSLDARKKTYGNNSEEAKAAKKKVRDIKFNRKQEARIAKYQEALNTVSNAKRREAIVKEIKRLQGLIREV